MKVKKFQEGGFLDEDDLFADPAIPVVGEDKKEGAGDLEGELVNPPGDGGEPPVDASKPALDIEPNEPLEVSTAAPVTPDDAVAPDDVDLTSTELTGVEEFLTNYGVKGGIIEFEDGEKKRFTDLSVEEQTNVLSSLVENSVPSVEEKYNLDDSEVNLLNTVRESGRSVEDFINDIVDIRVQSVVAQNSAASTDFETMSSDAMFVKHLKDKHPDLTDEVIASELSKAKELTTYEDTVGTIKQVYKAEQDKAAAEVSRATSEAFQQEVEDQRKLIVGTVEEIGDVAGAVINDDIKEYLLHDVLELNDNNDPILMEKIFSDPATMFKVNWFMNYGEDYIQNLNNYWKKQVSKASKQSYNQAVNGMPSTPTQGGQSGAPGKTAGQTKTDPIPSNSFGKIVTEEDLFG